MQDIPRIAPDELERGLFDEVLDVRSPSEYAEDHVEGAVLLPVLSDSERAEIGTLYRRDSFQARREGAARIARNVARHLETHFAAKPPGYRPLVYCWRGGQRSWSMATILRAVGWRASILEGGYKAYRAFLRADLERVIAGADLRFRVLAGLTGSGKTELLRWLADRGRVVLDLEGLAKHRGSILGDEPGEPQPAQRRFENLLWQALRRIPAGAEVWVESESNRIGALHVPATLWTAIRESPVTEIAVPRPGRAAYLLRTYGHFVEDPARLLERLRGLAARHGHPTVDRWAELVRAGRWPEFVEALLEEHYDPAYLRSRGRIFRPPVRRIELAEVGLEAFARAETALCEAFDEGAGKGAASAGPG